MRTIAGTRTFQCCRQIQPSACLEKGASVLSPVLPIKVNRQKMAVLVQKHGIDAHDKAAPPIIISRQVPTNNLIRYGKKTTVGTICALDPWLLANASHPFIGASRLVARSP